MFAAAPTPITVGNSRYRKLLSGNRLVPGLVVSQFINSDSLWVSSTTSILGFRCRLVVFVRSFPNSNAQSTAKKQGKDGVVTPFPQTGPGGYLQELGSLFQAEPLTVLCTFIVIVDSGN